MTPLNRRVVESLDVSLDTYGQARVYCREHGIKDVYEFCARRRVILMLIEDTATAAVKPQEAL